MALSEDLKRSALKGAQNDQTITTPESIKFPIESCSNKGKRNIHQINTSAA